MAGIVELLGERDWGELFLRGAAGCLLWTLGAIWVAAPVGILRGPGAAFEVFAALMNPPFALLSRLFRAFMGRHREEAERGDERRDLPALNIPLSALAPAVTRPPPGFENYPPRGRYRSQP